jgi:hypothetical protein
MKGGIDAEPGQDHQPQGPAAEADAGVIRGPLEDLIGEERGEGPEIALSELVPCVVPVMIDEHRGSLPTVWLVIKPLMSERGP